jgi:hypothetical protein
LILAEGQTTANNWTLETEVNPRNQPLRREIFSEGEILLAEIIGRMRRLIDTLGHELPGKFFNHTGRDPW